MGGKKQQLYSKAKSLLQVLIGSKDKTYKFFVLGHPGGSVSEMQPGVGGGGQLHAQHGVCL